MSKKAVVIGLGETGNPLFEILRMAYPGEVEGYDSGKGIHRVLPGGRFDFLNICFPWGSNFLNDVLGYIRLFEPEVTIIHSTVPVGTTRNFKTAVHSPILGRHNQMLKDLLTYEKWIGGERAAKAAAFFEKAGMNCRTCSTAEETELLKLMCLAKFGVDVAFARYRESLCERFGVPYESVVEWDHQYNTGVAFHMRRPLIVRGESKKIGGHCVIPGTKLLNHHLPNAMLEEVLKYG